MIYREWTMEQAGGCEPRSVALGVFDGLHLGHRSVIAAARDVVSKTVEQPTPKVTVFSIGGVPKMGGRLLTDESESELAEYMCVDEWLRVPFESIRHLEPEAFVQTVLHEKLNATVVCCGYNFRFGKDGRGDATLLRQLCEPLGMEVRVVDAVMLDGEVVSSTAVRCALAEGDMERVNALLGRPFTVAFPVCPGEQRGTTWGIPTINQPFLAGYEQPRFGVYASLVVVDGVQYRAITNIGVHPTVGNVAVPQAETYIADYSGDLYGKTVAVQLIRFLREEQQFDSVEALRSQIATDIETATAVLDGANGPRAILFDFDDTLQDRAVAFGGFATELIRRYSPHLSDEECARRAQIMVEENNCGYVIYVDYLNSFCERWGWSVDAQDLWRELRCRFPFYTALFEDTVEVLRELKRRGYRLGLITNGAADQQTLKVDVSGLRPLLDTVVIGGQEKVQKPNPEVFRRAAQRLCTAPQNCVYVGDYLPNDIVGSVAAGMTPIYIDVFGRGGCPDGVKMVDSLTALLEEFK